MGDLYSSSISSTFLRRTGCIQIHGWLFRGGILPGNALRFWFATHPPLSVYTKLTYSPGSWYRGHEIARRGGIFYTGLAAGTLTAGLIQAGASTRLEGVRGT